MNSITSMHCNNTFPVPARPSYSRRGRESGSSRAKASPPPAAEVPGHLIPGDAALRKGGCTRDCFRLVVRMHEVCAHGRSERDDRLYDTIAAGVMFGYTCKFSAHVVILGSLRALCNL